MSPKASTQLRDNDHSASLSAMLAPDKERGLTILLIGIPFDWGEQSASWDLGRWGGVRMTRLGNRPSAWPGASLPSCIMSQLVLFLGGH